MRAIALAALVLGLAVPFAQTTPAMLDPVGKWTFSTVSDTGQPMSGTLEIKGAPGNYTGAALTSDGNTVPITEVMTSPKAAIMILQLPASFVVVKITADGTGKFAGQWGEITQTAPVTMTRVGK